MAKAQARAVISELKKQGTAYKCWRCMSATALGVLVISKVRLYHMWNLNCFFLSLISR